MTFSTAEAQHKIDASQQRALKPKLWNRFLAQKNARLGLEQVQQLESTNRQQQEQIISANDRRLQSLTITTGQQDREIFKEFGRLIEFRESITNGLHWCLADAGLFHSRRFRVNFGLFPTSCTYAQLATVPSKNAYFRNAVQLVSPVLVNIGSLNTTPDLISAKLNKIKANCERYLLIQLDLTDFLKNNNNKQQLQQTSYALNEERSQLPFFRTKLDNELIKRCSEITSEIRNNIGK